MNNNDTIYTHRPIAGVSVGARSHNGRLYIAFSLVNDGFSRNGKFWQDRRDNFSREIARSIINGRIDRMINDVHDTELQMGIFLQTDMTARRFISLFREIFKPDTNENDNFLVNTLDFGNGLDLRSRPQACQIVDRLTDLANEVIANESANV
jgi:5-carboxymethyl-2-hydroxymuconate isomerase